MYCRKCGTVIDDSSNFCPVCGSKTINEYDGAEQQQSGQYYEQRNNDGFEDPYYDDLNDDGYAYEDGYDDEYEDDYGYYKRNVEHAPDPNRKSKIIVAVSIIVIVLALAAVIVFVVLPKSGCGAGPGEKTTKEEEQTETTPEDLSEEQTEEAEEESADAVATVIMPDVSGKKRDDAENELLRNHLKVEIQFEESMDVAEGYVIRQSIEPNRPLNEGDTVMLYIAKKAETTVSPTEPPTNTPETRTTTAAPETQTTTPETTAQEVTDVLGALTRDYWVSDGTVYSFYPDGSMLMYVEDPGWNMPWEQERWYILDENSRTLILGGYGDREGSKDDQTYSYSFTGDGNLTLTGSSKAINLYQSAALPSWLDVNVTHHFPIKYKHVDYTFVAADSTPIYKGPGTGYPQTGTVNQGDTVWIVAESGDWGLTDCNNPTSKKGWVDLSEVYR